MEAIGDRLKEVKTTAEFKTAIDVMIEEHVSEWGDNPTKLYIPDSDWHWLETIKVEMPFPCPRDVKDCRYAGMEIFGTIRVAHVK